jgi:hypothetical protein
MRRFGYVLGWGLVFATLQAGAQQQQQPSARKDDVKLAQAGDTRCRKEVKDYVEALRFVRQAAGTQVGDKVAGGYIAEPELDRVVSGQGYCAAAQLLRDRGAPR